jgi:hypothetical protein
MWSVQWLPELLVGLDEFSAGSVLLILLAVILTTLTLKSNVQAAARSWRKGNGDGL